MAGIMFPDFVGTIAKVSGIENAQAQRDWMDEDRASKKAVAPFVQKALQGDQAALGEIATRHPDTFMKIAPLLERMDAGKRAKVKEDADFITQNGMAILNAPPEQQPQLYARVRQEAEASGRNVSQWPTTYDPGWVKFNVDKAMPFSEHFKRSGEGVTFAPPAGGGGAGGDPAKAIGGIESGGRYDAVGPVANDKGQRAYGKYQVMDFNVGPWTAEILGKAMTPQEFLANPQAQDAVFNAKFGQYVKQHGSPEAAARAWFAGPGGMNNPNAKDVLGTTVAGYEKKFTAGMGGPSGAPPGMAVGADMPPADASGTPLPPAQQALQPLRGLQIPQGARVALQGGVPIVKDGNVLYLDANGGWGAAPLPSRAEPKAAGAGPFAGTGTEAQALNMLIANGTLTQQQAAELAAGKTITNPADGSVVFMTPSGLFSQKPGQPPQPTQGGAPPPAAAPSGVQPGVPAAPATPAGMIQVTPPKPTGQPTPKELQDIRAARSEAEAMIKALEDFRSEAKSATAVDRGLSVTGATTGLNTSYNIAALLAKGEALFNLGVLNGPDLDIIRRTLPDPSTFRGAAASSEAMSGAVDKVIGVIKSKVEAREKQLGITPSGGDSKASQGTYLGPDNRPVSWQEIESTAKGRKITPDEVIRMLGLKPTGMQ